MAYTFQPPEINGDTESIARWLYRLNEYLEYYLNDLENQAKAQTEKEENARGVGNQIRIGDTLIQGGRVLYSAEETVAGGVATKAVTFAEEFEGKPYSVVVSVQTANPSLRSAAAQNITASGFDCKLYRDNQGATAVEYIAIGKYKKGI
jgi:hypothetical protein